MPSHASDSLEYRGEQFKLTKSYSDYHDYKDDPDHINPSENIRVERAVTRAKVSAGALTRVEMVREVFDLRFPGYGMQRRKRVRKAEKGSGTFITFRFLTLFRPPSILEGMVGRDPKVEIELKSVDGPIEILQDARDARKPGARTPG